jgi:hypothetical protein
MSALVTYVSLAGSVTPLLLVRSDVDRPILYPRIPRKVHRSDDYRSKVSPGVHGGRTGLNIQVKR